jgi:hypothetical protein
MNSEDVLEEMPKLKLEIQLQLILRGYYGSYFEVDYWGPVL